MKSRKSVAYLFLFILLGGLAFSCQNRPREVLGRKQMERLMYDVYVAEATMENDYQRFNTPEQKEAYINKVFRLHKTTQAQWDTSLSWYSDRIDLYLKMNDSVKSRLQRTRKGIDDLVAKRLQAQQFNPALLPPSYLPPVYTFPLADAKRGFRFRLDSAEVSSRITGDDFLFTFSAIGIPPRFSSSLTSLLTMVYSDTTIYRFRQIDENRTYELTGSKYIPGDTLTEVRGFVHLRDSTGIIPHIQLYGIFFGDKRRDVLEADTLAMELDSLAMGPDTLPMGLDTLAREPLTPLPARLPRPDTIIRFRPDSIRGR